MVTIETIKFVLEGVMLPIIGGLGLVGNLASIAVLRSRGIDLKQSFCQVRYSRLTLAIWAACMLYTIFALCQTQPKLLSKLCLAEVALIPNKIKLL